MSSNKLSSKQSGPTTLYGRQVAYDREICIVICSRFLLGEDFRAICAKLPMPVEAVFLGWVVVKSLQTAPATEKWSLVGIMGAGVVLMLAARFILRSPFFRIPLESAPREH